MTDHQPTLCNWCAKADKSCPVYPKVTMSCVEFTAEDGAMPETLLGLAQALRAGAGNDVWTLFAKLVAADLERSRG